MIITKARIVVTSQRTWVDKDQEVTHASLWSANNVLIFELDSYFKVFYRIVFIHVYELFCMYILFHSKKKCVKQNNALGANGFSLGLQEWFNQENLSW